MRRPLSLDVLLITAVGVSCVGDVPLHFVQPEACALVLACYFGDSPDHSLASDASFEGLFPADDALLVVDTYGSEGSCWRGDEALATSCADRCKGLLWQDCATPYRLTCVDAAGVDTGAVCSADADCGTDATCPSRPFCGGACALRNALPCRFEDFAKVDGQRQETEPLFSACPSEAHCNAAQPPLQGNERSPERFGCCDLPAHLDTDGSAAPITVGSTADGSAIEQPCATALEQL